MSEHVSDEVIEYRREVLIELRQLYDRLADALAHSGDKRTSVVLTREQMAFVMGSIRRVFAE